jgi:hypothetical protein
MLQGINVREKAKALIELIQVAYAMHSRTMRGLRSELRVLGVACISTPLESDRLARSLPVFPMQ